MLILAEHRGLHIRVLIARATPLLSLNDGIAELDARVGQNARPSALFATHIALNYKGEKVAALLYYTHICAAHTHKPRKNLAGTSQHQAGFVYRICASP